MLSSPRSPICESRLSMIAAPPHGSAAAGPPSSAAAVATSTAVVTLPDRTGGLGCGGLFSSVAIVLGQFGQQRLPLPADLVDFELPCLLDRGRAVALPLVRVLDQLTERVRHRRDILGRHQDAVAAGLD